MLCLQGVSCAPGEGHAAGRALLQTMYEAYTRKPMPAIAVTQRGKPYFPGDDLHFSISHTRSHVFCVLSNRPVGIDAEELDRRISLPLADKILSPTETDQYEAAADKRLALLTFWVLKEAQAKCTGDGLRGYPNQTAFSLEDSRVFHKDGCVIAVIEEDNHAL